MVFLNWTELPWFWHGFDMFWFAALMAVLVPGMLAFVFGYLAFRSRVTGVYLSIITQALTYALMLAFYRNEMGFGGNNGLTDFKDLLGFDLQSDATRIGLFVASALALAFGYLACRFIVASRLGRRGGGRARRRVTHALHRLPGRPGEARPSSPSRPCWPGVAGALYVPQVGIINPDEFSPLNSIELVIWVAVGGRATLYGAVIGALLVNYGKTDFTGVFPEAWLFALGGLFVLVTLFLPHGIAGLFRLLRRRGRSEPPSDSEPAGTAAGGASPAGAGAAP